MITAQECLTYLESSGLTRTFVARELDCNYTTVYRILKGKVNPRPGMVEKIRQMYVERKRFLAELDRLSKEDLKENRE